MCISCYFSFKTPTCQAVGGDKNVNFIGGREFPGFDLDMGVKRKHQ